LLKRIDRDVAETKIPENPQQILREKKL